MRWPSEKTGMVLAFACLLLVCLPRFNGNQLFVKQQPYDARYFQAYVEYFRGETPSAPIRPASNWRFLLPLLAAPLPFSAATSLNLINLLCLSAALYFFYQTLRLLHINRQKRWLAIALFIFSFPTFYYSCISYVDPGAIFFISIGIYFWIREKPLYFSIALLLGLMAKETSILLLPFAFIHALVQRKYGLAAYVILLSGIFFLEYHWIKALVPLSDGELRFNQWHISTAATRNNFQRMHTTASLLLSLGLPLIFMIRKFLKSPVNLIRNPLTAASFAGLVATFVLYLYSYISTIADGRIIWQGYFFMLLLIFDNQLKEDPSSQKTA